MTGRMPLFVQFVPLSLFAAYAFWTGPLPSRERWMTAFVLGGAAAVVQLVLVFRQPAPVNRLLLGANLYLVVGGVAAATRWSRVMLLYAGLAESGIFAWMLAVGVVTTVLSPAGYIGRPHVDRTRVRIYSLALLGLTAAALGMSLVFHGNTTWAAVVPVTGLAIANQVLAHRLAGAPGVPATDPAS